MNGWEITVVGLLLVTACWTDVRNMRIPNELTVVFAGSGLLYQTFAHGILGLGWAITGALAGFVPLYAMNRLGGMGGGDVKWFGAFGMWAGASLTAWLVMLSILYAGGIACVLMLLRLPGIRIWGGKLKWPWGSHPLAGGRGVQFPFMLAVAPGFVTLLWKG
ncbi:A24 family peptidase [Cohnella endophytica]|uniref:A24 family peptidase n=1 Tax=Cohnella endophytica TaxID=2419778 RepID=UPI001314C87A|nr:prepilin peptidase [Cohnella endophytica]